MFSINFNLNLWCLTGMERLSFVGLSAVSCRGKEIFKLVYFTLEQTKTCESCDVDTENNVQI